MFFVIWSFVKQSCFLKENAGGIRQKSIPKSLWKALKMYKSAIM